MLLLISKNLSFLPAERGDEDYRYRIIGAKKRREHSCFRGTYQFTAQCKDGCNYLYDVIRVLSINWPFTFGMFPQVTSGIHGELQNHHAILDKMSQGMSGASLGLGATVGKFRRIMENPQSRKSMYIALVAAVALFVLYLWWTR